MSLKEEFQNKQTIQEKEAPMAPREPASDSKIGQRVLAIRRAESLQTNEIAPSDFNSLEYEIMSTFEMVDLDD
jgi:MFS family permease